MVNALRKKVDKNELYHTRPKTRMIKKGKKVMHEMKKREIKRLSSGLTS